MIVQHGEVLRQDCALSSKTFLDQNSYFLGTRFSKDSFAFDSNS